MSVAARPENESLPPDADLPTGDEFESGDEQPHGYEYRELSGLAVVSVVVGLLAWASIVLHSLFHPMVFAILPALGATIGWRAWRKIADSEGDLTGTPIAIAGLWISLGALAAGWGTMAYVYATEVPEGYTRIQYSQLKLDENGALPPDITHLNGQKVFIKGYVYPDKDTTGIKKFILCRDNGDCCFGGKPPISDMIEVSLAPPQTLTFHTYQFKVYGTFRFEPSRSVMQDEVGAVLYHIDDARFVE